MSSTYRPHGQSDVPQIWLGHGENKKHQAPPLVSITYKQCLKNHAASLGAHALDGCGEFMFCPSAILTDPTSLKCAACGCHRNFHFQQPYSNNNNNNYLLLTLNAVKQHDPPHKAKGAENTNGRKRFRTKFSGEQKEKMHSFADKLGWRMQGSDQLMVEEFCTQVGISKSVLKVWMHNNKTNYFIGRP